MNTIAVEVPQAVMYDTKMTAAQTQKFINETVALEYYKNHGISLGYCAEIAGMTKEDFLKFLGTQEISVFNFEDKEEFLEELNNA